MILTQQEKQLIIEILHITDLHTNMTHEHQLDRLRLITDSEKFQIQKVQEILDIKYSTAQAYFKTAKRSKTGNTMGNKMPLEYICRLCLHYGKSLKWFLGEENI